MFTFASNSCGPRRDNTLRRRVGVSCHPITDSQTRMCHARMALKLSARLLYPGRCGAYMDFAIEFALGVLGALIVPYVVKQART